MQKLPAMAADLIRELDRTIPERCIGAHESLEDAHRYAGKRELVLSLLLRLKASEAAGSDPTQPLLKKA